MKNLRLAPWILVFLVFPASLLAEPVPLKRVVELALTHGTGPAIAAADELHAAAAYRELRNEYIPQVVAGAGLGYSYGFPLSLEGSAPSLFNLNAQSVLFSPGLRGFLKSARLESSAAGFKSRDQRNQIIQDTVLSYAELQKWEQRLSRLRGTETEAEKTQAAVVQRVKEGVDSEIEGTKARLSVARLRLRIAEAQGAADVLRERLAKLTGLAAAGIQTDPDSMPAMPAESSPDASTPDKLAESNPNVQAAVDHARAQYFRAQAEHRAWWPSVDFAAQYALLSTYNNYDQYYKSFQQSNATVGLSIRFPIFNASQRARADGADSDALKATRQAEAARNLASEDTLRLQRSVAQMQAAREVAQLEYEIAQKSLPAVQTRIDAGTATLHDLDDASSQASERFISLQDVTFELQRAQLELLRSTGDLEKWALGSR
jgi:outer membrane protein TolC